MFKQLEVSRILLTCVVPDQKSLLVEDPKHRRRQRAGRGVEAGRGGEPNNERDGESSSKESRT